MTQIDFHYSDNLVNYLLKISEQMAQLNIFTENIDKRNKHFLLLERTLQIENLYHFGCLTNAGASYKNTYAFKEGMLENTTQDEHQILMNLRDIIDYIEAFYRLENFDLNQFIHINKLFLNGLVDVWDYGKLLQTKYELDNKYNLLLEKKIIRESESYQIMEQLVDYGLTNPTAAIIKYAVIFYEIITNAFFSSGNDIAAIGLFVFMYRKLHFHPLINYYKVISQVLEKRRELNSVSLWLEYFFEELEHELEYLLNRLLPFVALAFDEKKKYVDINIRQVKGIDFLKTKESISREMYAKLNKVSSITSYRDLSDLVRKNYIHPVGVGKATRYKLEL